MVQLPILPNPEQENRERRQRVNTAVREGVEVLDEVAGQLDEAQSIFERLARKVAALQREHATLADTLISARDDLKR